MLSEELIDEKLKYLNKDLEKYDIHILSSRKIAKKILRQKELYSKAKDVYIFFSNPESSLRSQLEHTNNKIKSINEEWEAKVRYLTGHDNIIDKKKKDFLKKKGMSKLTKQLSFLKWMLSDHE